ncbi:hypothetical protein ADUPG1_012314 [Aduncisulcus paluster]|uniref:Tyr recombinase domain-containing protein n=1 Tax=Aduncisulcus paluster TaxID=2918883 RepID=A0ABQ5K2T2_9EUKA|nr:hypothetical protein ADUPG1_012314 [Aduncisulcus paluster]
MESVHIPKGHIRASENSEKARNRIYSLYRRFPSIFCIRGQSSTRIAHHKGNIREARGCHCPREDDRAIKAPRISWIYSRHRKDGDRFVPRKEKSFIGAVRSKAKRHSVVQVAGKTAGWTHSLLETNLPFRGNLYKTTPRTVTQKEGSFQTLGGSKGRTKFLEQNHRTPLVPLAWIGAQWSYPHRRFPGGSRSGPHETWQAKEARTIRNHTMPCTHHSHRDMDTTENITTGTTREWNLGLGYGFHSGKISSVKRLKQVVTATNSRSTDLGRSQIPEHLDHTTLGEGVSQCRSRCTLTKGGYRFGHNGKGDHWKMGSVFFNPIPGRWRSRPSSVKKRPTWKIPSPSQSTCRVGSHKVAIAIGSGSRSISLSLISDKWAGGNLFTANPEARGLFKKQCTQLFRDFAKNGPRILGRVVNETQEDGTIDRILREDEAADVTRTNSTAGAQRRVRHIIRHRESTSKWWEELAVIGMELLKNVKPRSAWSVLTHVAALIAGRFPTELKKTYVRLATPLCAVTTSQAGTHILSIEEAQSLIRHALERGRIDFAAWVAVTFETVSRAGSTASIRLNGIEVRDNAFVLWCPKNKTISGGMKVRVNVGGPLNAYSLLNRLIETHKRLTAIKPYTFLFAEPGKERPSPLLRLQENFRTWSGRLFKEKYGAHSMRKGAAVLLHKMGVEAETIAALGGWLSSQGLLSYISTAIREDEGWPMESSLNH